LFPPSKTTNLRNEITRFQQRFDESFSEAWDRFNDLLRACPHHGFFELHQLDTFYIALNVNDQDSLNSAAVVAKVNSSSSTLAISFDVAELKDMVRALLLDKKNQSSAPATSSTPALVKAVETNCVTCGGTHSYQNCPATSGNVYQDNIQEYVSQAASANYNQGNTSFRPQMIANQIRPLGFPPVQNNQNNFNRGNNFTQNQGGPTIPTPSKVVKQGIEVTKDKVQTPSSQSTTYFQPPVTQSVTSVSEPIAAPVSAPMPNLKPSIPYPSRHDNERRPITYNLDQTSRYLANYDQMTANKIDVTDEGCEEYFQEVLDFSDVTTSGSPTPSDDPIVSTTSPTLTPFGDSNFLLFEEANAFLGLEDDPDSPELDPSYYDPEGDIQMLEAILNSDPAPSLPNHEQSVPSFTNELKAWKLKRSNLPLMNLLSPLVSPVHCVPKKGRSKNEENELIPTRLVTGWRVCINYRKLNEATRKDHFPLPFMDQMLERLAGSKYYCFLDGLSGYFQIPIDPRDQEKKTFTCPYGTFAYRRMPFGLCNVPGTFQRCMLAIFHDMVEKTMEVFMDDFSVFGNSFETCLSRLDKMMQRCEDTKLCLNWEKSHFMVKEGIVLGHKISRNRIEVNKAKVDVITKLPHPTTVKCVRSFLGHAGFYR
nr:reverse transcriptase domain-containing protein [Tanacetum cinerariifolium]